MASKWWTLAVVCLAIFMLLLDITVVNVALPQRAVDHIAEAVSSGGASAAARGAPGPLRGLVEQAARRAYIEGLNEILVVAAVVAFVGAALALLLVRGRDFVTVPAGAPPPGAAEAAP